MEEIAIKFIQENPKYGSKLNKIGGGNFGEVFETDKGYIVKITKDKEEAKTAIQIAKKANGKFTPTYHTLKSIGDKYILVMDKVEPISLNSEQNVMLNIFRDKILKMIKSGEDISQFKKAVLINVKDKKLAFVLSGMIDVIQGLKDIGIINADIHEDNLGVSNGKIVMLDVVDEKLVKESFRMIIREITKKVYK